MAQAHQPKKFTPHRPDLTKRLGGLDPMSSARKIWWRGGMTEFTRAFAEYGRREEDGKDVDIYAAPERYEIIFREKIDKWIRQGNLEQADWWGFEAYKRVNTISPRRSTPLAMMLAQIEGDHPFSHLEDGLAKIMLTFAYGSVDMQKRFTHHLKAKLLEYKKSIRRSKYADQKIRNKYGEIRKELDDWANKVLCKTMLQTGEIKKIYSEELDGALDPNDGRFKYEYKRGKYIITFDPLDGSANIETRDIFGSIMGVYEENVPKTGRELKASAIVIYGPMFSLIYRTGDGSVVEITKDYGERGFSQFNEAEDGKNIRIPQKPQVFSPAGNKTYDPEFRDFVVREFWNEYSMRSSGAAVEETNRILRVGGTFFYPASEKMPDGKLRLVYECNPLAYLIEGAGGVSWDGRTGSILDVPIVDMDMRVPFFAGNGDLVEKFKEFYRYGS